jgi:hypothetical protein
MRGISWLAAKTGQLLKKDSAPWSKCFFVIRAAYVEKVCTAGHATDDNMDYAHCMLDT